MMLRNLTHFGSISLIAWNSLTHIKVLKLAGLVIVICTPLMCRVHQYVQQAQEIVFCDSTSSLDRFNNFLFVISTANAIGGLPLSLLMKSRKLLARV